MKHILRVACAALGVVAMAGTTDLSELDSEPKPPATAKVDWLIDPSPFTAKAYRGASPDELVLSNGLIRRVFRFSPNAATVAFDNLVSGESVIRGVKPEARVSLDGQTYDVGGLVGQPNFAFLRPEWVDDLRAKPGAMRFVGFEVGAPEKRIPWKRVRHHDESLAWPPKGVSLRLDFALPTGDTLSSDAARPTLWTDEFQRLSDDWTVCASDRHERTSFINEGKPGEIFGLASAHCFAERKIAKDTALIEAAINPGSDNATSWGPGMAWVFERGVVKFNLRPGDRGAHGQFELRVNGHERLASVKPFATEDGGLDAAKTYRLRMRQAGAQIVCEAAIDDERAPAYHQLFAIERAAGWGESVVVRVGKMDRSGGASDEVQHLGELTRSRVESVAVYGPVDDAELARLRAERESSDEGGAVRVSVHYEIYDGLPALRKWITAHNGTDQTVRLNRFVSEILAAVEYESRVEARGVHYPTPNIHVETDFAFGGMTVENSNHHVVRWEKDPDYKTQVGYLRETPCLLEVKPEIGPEQDIAPGATFESFNAFILPLDGHERERNGLARRRMYRVLAPWTTENPLMHHMRIAQPDAVLKAIDQAAEVGFEMLILSFGSGFNMENDSPEYLKTWKEIADYAHSKNIEIGSYSLLSSRRIGGGHDSVMKEGWRATHGNMPCIGSEWGQNYFKKLYNFYETTGFDLLEHDGSYPGDPCAAEHHPGHRGWEDSRWNNYQTIADFYKWCRGRGVYLNVPDYYFYAGSNKNGMGYREVNWSLPREQQVIHTRQNIFDGTWTKTSTMGWMFVPLTQYHGGGAAATIEPLHQHLDHYERMIVSNLGAGVQACYRGPRLYDTDETKAMVKKWVDWYKAHRAVLEGDMIHLRRADARDLDYWLMVNPRGAKERGMLMVFNPLREDIDKTLRVPLYYTGLTNTAQIRANGSSPKEYKLDREYQIELNVTIPAGGFGWYVIEGQ